MEKEQNHHSKDFLVNRSMIIDCELKDEAGLNDFQKLPTKDKISIPFVGINRFRTPLKFIRNNELVTHDCEVAMGVSLPVGKTGINMSRLVEIITKVSEEKTINFKSLKEILTHTRIKLRDNKEIDDINSSNMSIDFNFALKQPSLSSDNWGWQYYKCKMEGELNKNTGDKFYLTVNYEYSSTCPCSLSMAKQYERDYLTGKTDQGNGVATAHSQRSQIKCKIELSQKAFESNFFVADLVGILRKAIPTETQSLVKREDEQAFAILNGSNPMFVEHTSKRLWTHLNENPNISDWKADIEHWESLHSHNAVASISKGLNL